MAAFQSARTAFTQVEMVYAAATAEECVDLVSLHRRLAHIALDAIRKTIKGGAIEAFNLSTICQL